MIHLFHLPLHLTNICWCLDTAAGIGDKRWSKTGKDLAFMELKLSDFISNFNNNLIIIQIFYIT